MTILTISIMLFENHLCCCLRLFSSLYGILFYLRIIESFFFFFNVFLTAWGLRCCAQAFPSYSDQGLLFVAVRRLLIAVASLVSEHRL